MKKIENTGSKDTRSGFGEGLYELGKLNPRVVRSEEHTSELQSPMLSS